MAGSWGEFVEEIIAAGAKAVRNPGVTKTAKEVVKEVITKAPRLTSKILQGRARELELEAIKVYDDYVTLAGKVYQPGGGGWTQSVANEQIARMKEFRRLFLEMMRELNTPLH